MQAGVTEKDKSNYVREKLIIKQIQKELRKPVVEERTRFESTSLVLFM